MKIKRLIIASLFALSLCSCDTAGNSSSVNEAKPLTTTDTSVSITTEADATATTEASTNETEQEVSATIPASTKPPMTAPYVHSFSVHYIDVGQADASLVECDGHYMLIDGGNVEDSNLIYSVLERDKITNLDIVVGTHAHEDHIGGLSGALQYATADMVLCPVTEYDSQAFKNFKSYAEKKSSGITVPKVNNRYFLGDAEVTILGANSTEETNNSSIVLMIRYGDTKFLFTGDAERDAEQAILNSGADLSCNVLKVGHHGSETSTSYIWLDAVFPEYAVISVGAGNTYNHPTDATLSRLRDADVKTFRTDLNGDVYATSDGKTVTMSADKEVSPEQIFTAGSPSKSQSDTKPTENKKPAPEQQGSASSNEFDYVLNTNSMKFHSTSCSSANKISNKNRKEYTGTREDLTSQGYSPCGYCNP